jgi:hypothetical protein
MKTTLHLLAGLLMLAPTLSEAQSGTKKTVYGEIGLGFGRTLFFGDMRQKLQAAIGAGDFTPNSGGNFTTAFYVAPEAWRGFGLGVRAKVFGAGGSPGEEGEEYFFNYYHAGVSAKYYPFSRQFNRGFYARSSYGPGQFTAKRDYKDEARTYRHQFAIGSTLLGGIGYTWALKSYSLSLEVEAERARRNGTISGIGEDQVFRSGQLGANFIVTF